MMKNNFECVEAKDTERNNANTFRMLPWVMFYVKSDKINNGS